jgi:cytochrome c
MKKLFVLTFILSLIVACGGSGTENKKETVPPKEEDITENPVYQKAMDIISKSDCNTCHKIDEKNIGPPWREVANKYAGQSDAVEYLAKKIIDGGSGVWGQVPMAPHAAMSKEDAETLAKYVLLLKK